MSMVARDCKSTPAPVNADRLRTFSERLGIACARADRARAEWLSLQCVSGGGGTDLDLGVEPATSENVS